MSLATFQSPLMHGEISLEDAVRDSLQWYREPYGVCCAYTTHNSGWQRTIMEAGALHGGCAILLREIMNTILARSLEMRL